MQHNQPFGTVDGWSEMQETIEKRFQNYLWVIAATAAIGVAICMLTTDLFWGLLISVCIVPIACIFACGVVAVVEVFMQRRTPDSIHDSEPVCIADELVEEPEAT